MQSKQQQKKTEKQTVQELEGQRELQDQPVTKKKRGQKQVRVAVTPTRNSTATTSPSHTATPRPPLPASMPQSYHYSTPQYYAMPQRLTYNPYSFMQYPYTMRPQPPFYSYIHTPTQAPIHSPHPLPNTASQNPNTPSSSTMGT